MVGAGRFTVSVSRFDRRPGGVFHYSMQAPVGHRMGDKPLWGKFVYHEVALPERIILLSAFSDEGGGLARHPARPTWPMQVRSNYTFTEQNGHTTVAVCATPHEATQLERNTFTASRALMQKDVKESFAQLERYLAKLDGNRASTTAIHPWRPRSLRVLLPVNKFTSYREESMSTTAQQEVTTPTQTTTGNFVWHELRTTDTKAAEAFYTHVIGWQAKGSGDPAGVPYTLLSAGDLDTAGLMGLTPEMVEGGMKPGWVGFIGVDDVDGYAKRVEQGGGKLHCPPMDIPNCRPLRLGGRPARRGVPTVQGQSQVLTAPPPVGTPGAVGWNELSANDEGSAWAFYSSIFGWSEDKQWIWARWAPTGFSTTAALRWGR